MREEREYTEEQRVEALAALLVNGGKVRATGRQLGIPPRTLLDWRNIAIAADNAAGKPESLESRFAHDPHKRADHGALWGSASELAARLVRKNLIALAKAPLTPQQLREIAVVGGISTDKHLDYTQGRKSTSVNVDARSVNLTQLSDEQLERLAAGAPQLGSGDSEHTG